MARLSSSGDEWPKDTMLSRATLAVAPTILRLYRPIRRVVGVTARVTLTPSTVVYSIHTGNDLPKLPVTLLIIGNGIYHGYNRRVLSSPASPGDGEA